MNFLNVYTTYNFRKILTFWKNLFPYLEIWANDRNNVEMLRGIKILKYNLKDVVFSLIDTIFSLFETQKSIK